MVPDRALPLVDHATAVSLTTFRKRRHRDLPLTLLAIAGAHRSIVAPTAAIQQRWRCRGWRPSDARQIITVHGEQSVAAGGFAVLVLAEQVQVELHVVEGRQRELYGNSMACRGLLSSAEPVRRSCGSSSGCRTQWMRMAVNARFYAGRNWVTTRASMAREFLQVRFFPALASKPAQTRRTFLDAGRAMAYNSGHLVMRLALSRQRKPQGRASVSIRRRSG